MLTERQQRNRERKAEAEAAQQEQRRLDQAKQDEKEFAQLLALGERYAQMPGDDFFGKWMPLVGYGQRCRERFSREEVDFWVGTELGPRPARGHLVQRNWFASEWGVTLFACGRLSLIYTVDTSSTGRGMGNDLRDYSLCAGRVQDLGGATRQEVCEAAVRLLSKDLTATEKQLTRLTRQLIGFAI